MKYESEKGDGNYLTHLLFESIDFKKLYKEALDRGLEGSKVGDYAKNFFIRALVKEFG